MNEQKKKALASVDRNAALYESVAKKVWEPCRLRTCSCTMTSVATSTSLSMATMVIVSA